MKTFRIHVGEIEHDSDLENAMRWIRKAGGDPVVVEVDFDSEGAIFDVKVPEEGVARFKEVWRKTEFIFEGQA